jgi:RNA-dependent RNA polymerase
LGGAKGVLVVDNNPDSFKTEDEDKQCLVMLRKSQIKFESENWSLNIVRCASYSQGYLNRQTVTLLHCLGVPEEYFVKK